MTTAVPAPSAGASSGAPSGRAARTQSPFWRNMRKFADNRLALASGVVVVLFVVMAVAAPLIAPHDPNATDLFRRLQPPAWMAGGEWAYPLGCDALGRDILSRIIYGARISIFIGTAVILVATTIGILAGLAAGYLRGWVDTAISRVVDILLAFPYLIFAIGLMAMMGPGLSNIVIALAYKEWVIPCRVVRGETLAAREMEYVEAARALGAGRARIMWREILPNILSPVVVVSTIRMANVIILEASLSFLGLGVQPPTASWGSMVADGRAFMLEAWWVSTFPGLAILLLVLSLNVASQGLRDAFDPKFHD
ncbi:ABC transporter permease [Caenispirillum salinarum]|uniref:ABC transporter permease n=1 Tax=Caenispirillum salinarum TaxID=859058 RepID=UPI0038506A31